LHGGDFEEQMRQRQHELAVADELNITLDTDPSQTSLNGATQFNEVAPTQHPTQHEQEPE